MAEFFHGVKVTEKLKGVIPFVEVPSAIIGLVGTSPLGKKDEIFVVRNWDEALEVFGEPTPNSTIHKALRAYFDHKDCTCLVVSVGENPEEVADTDVTEGLQLFEKAKSTFGFFPKILDAPGFSDKTTVAQAMSALADKIRAVAFINAPAGASPEEALSFKNNFSSKRTFCFYPRVKVLDPATGDVIYDWLSSRAAGLTVKTDFEKGFHVSPSNKELKGVVGLERVLTYVPNDPTSELQYINSQGIISVKRDRDGFRLFGNCSTAFPAHTHPAEVFINWVRVSDILDETIEDNLVQTLDENIIDNPNDPTTSIVYRIRESVDDILNTWKAKGIIISGSAEVPLELNTPSELALGQVHYRINDFAVSSPLQGITIERVANSDAIAEVFQKLFGGNQ
jgi:phage tail sheath protein FI